MRYLLLLCVAFMAGCASNGPEVSVIPSIPDTTAPTVSFTSPANGSVAVPYDRKISVAFSEAMDPATITTATFTLTGPSLAVIPGAVASTGPSAVFTPATQLAAGITYTATVKAGVKDLAGNALASDYVWSFTTGAADIIAPTVSFTAPLNGAIEVPTNRIIHVSFSEVMDPLTITAATFKISGPGVTPVEGTVTPIGTSATFTPKIALAHSTTYTGTITTGAKDLAGNALANSFVWSFTTGATADSIAPTVTVTSPVNTAPAVPVNRKIGIAFSEVMDPLTVSTATVMLKGPGTTPVAGAVTIDGTSALFAPAANLADNTLYSVTVTNGVKDLAGNAMTSNYVFTFTTAAVVPTDTIAPTVTVTSPTNTAIAVPVNRKVNVGFSETMDPSTITALTFVMKGPGGVAVPGAVSVIDTAATFIPASNLADSTLYTVTITSGVKDLAGNAMASNYVFTFTTSAALDSTKPSVIATINANGATNVPPNTKAGATFSEVMDNLTITNQSFTLKQGVTSVPGVVSYSGVNALFSPTNILANNTEYTATITTAAKDLAGNAMASNYVWSWTTAAAADTTRPTVILVNPADLATNVAINSAVHATFSKAMDPLTISTASFTLKDGVTPVTGLVTYDSITKIATFTPSSILATNTTYTATIINTAEDLAGNTLLNNKVWSFTTAAAVVPPIEPPASHLGTASTYGIMATSAITNTGATTKINGDVALEPGTSNGLLPVQVNGAIHIGDTVAKQAYADLLVAYNYYKTLPPGVTITAGADLGALYPLGIPPGTYTSGSTMSINTHLTLDGGGNANAVWVFQIGSSITTTTPLGTISLINGANANNIFWVPTASATIGVGTTFYGTIVAGVSITGQTGAVINGRLLAGAVGAGTIALDTNVVNVP